ncbi:MAG: UbiA prenyltransferase family protein [Phycisphaerales bacterium]|nr:UbiA prenyltransferase family protein [Phycisphaerales bacterium]
MSQSPSISPTVDLTTRPAPRGLAAWLKLLRLHQWTKGAFVVVGPLYGQALDSWHSALAVVAAFLAFGFASSGCYVINDLRDREVDRTHPRKRRRPLAAGTINVTHALSASGACLAIALALPWLAMLAGAAPPVATHSPVLAALLTTIIVVAYIINTIAYSIWFKNVAIVDVMSLSMGFVLRVLAGCAAVMVEPSAWLLNVTLFLAMFLAFGKRLGERRTMGEENAASARSVQAQYTEDLLRMVVVVTAVACLVTYSVYVTSAPARRTYGMNLLWITMLPATFALLRAILLLERGRYDDPTELAISDRPFQLAALLFALITVAIMAIGRVAVVS